MRLWPILFLLGSTQSVLAGDIDDARSRVAAHDYQGAFRYYARWLAQAPEDVDRLIEVARVHAWADDHEVAIELYQRALKAAPARRGDIEPALAFQLLWNNKGKTAVEHFFRLLAKTPADRALRHGLADALANSGQTEAALAIYQALFREQPSDLNAGNGAGRMWLWLGDNTEAEQAYRAVLAQSPNDREARWGLARSLNWGGQHRAAYQLYRELDREIPKNPDIYRESASALHWAGFDALALERLQGWPDPDSLQQVASIRRELRPWLRLGLDLGHDSDLVHSQSLNFEYHQNLDDAQELDLSGSAGSLKQRQGHDRGGYDYQQTVGSHDWRVRRVLADYRVRLGQVDDAIGVFWPSVALGQVRYDDWQKSLWRLRGRYSPVDRWRLDAEFGNGFIDNPEALFNHVSYDDRSLELGYRHDVDYALAVNVGQLEFNDGNHRRRWGAWYEHAILPKRLLTLGVATNHFHDSEFGKGLGYYSPEQYREYRVYGDTEFPLGAWTVNFRGAVGQLTETPGSDSRLYAGALKIGRDLGPDQHIALSLSRSNSRSLSANGGDGYSRTAIGLEWSWRLP